MNVSLKKGFKRSGLALRSAERRKRVTLRRMPDKRGKKKKRM